MIERVARAILKRRYYDCEPEAYGNDVDGFMWKLDPDHLIDAHEEARAAIEAMREPTSKMRAVGAAVPIQTFDGPESTVLAEEAGEIFTAMINAALEERT